MTSELSPLMMAYEDGLCLRPVDRTPLRALGESIAHPKLYVICAPIIIQVGTCPCEVLGMGNVSFGIPMIDEFTPEGLPRNSFVLLIGEGGTGKSVTIQQIAGAWVKKGEPCIMVAFDDDPESILNNFDHLGYCSKDALNANLLRIIDCFSFRTKTPKKIDDHIDVVSNPRDRQQLTSAIYAAVKGMDGKGAVFIDSITELFTMSEPTSTIEMIKDWRAEICKAKHITAFAAYHLGMRSLDEFVGMLDYVVDGILEFRFDPLFAQQGVLARQVRLRKMKGASHDAFWHYFTIGKKGVVPMNTKNDGAPSLGAQRARAESHRLPK